MISFPCICGENWFCRRSVASFQSDVIHRPRKGPFCYDIQDQIPFFIRQISALSPSTKNIFPVATKSISSRRYQLFRIRRSSSLPWKCALFFTPEIISGWVPFFPPGTVPHRGPAGPYSYPLQSVPAPSGHGLHPGAGQDLRLFSSYLYISPDTELCYHVKKNIKQKTGSLSQSRSLSFTPKYIAVTGRNVPM